MVRDSNSSEGRNETEDNPRITGGGVLVDAPQYGSDESSGENKGVGYGGSRLRRWFRRFTIGLTSLAVISGINYVDNLLSESYEKKFFIRSSDIQPHTSYGFNPFNIDPSSGEITVERTANFGYREWNKPIVVVGGSNAAGTGAEKDGFKFYYLSFLGEASRLTGIDVETASYPGYKAPQVLRVVNDMVLPRNPRAVIYLGGYNDAILDSVMGRGLGEPSNFDAIKRQLDHPEYGVIFNALNFLRLEGIAKKYMFGRLNNVQSMDEEFRLEEEMRTDRLRVFENNLRGISRLCNSAKVPFIFIAEPEPFSVKSDFDGRFPRNKLREDYYGLVWQDYVGLARDVCEEENVGFYDGTFVVSPNDFYEPPHFDLEGHKDFGRFLADIILENNLQ